MFLHHYNVNIYQTPVSSISKVHFYRSVIFYTVTAHKLQPEVKKHIVKTTILVNSLPQMAGRSTTKQKQLIVGESGSSHKGQGTSSRRERDLHNHVNARWDVRNTQL